MQHFPGPPTYIECTIVYVATSTGHIWAATNTLLGNLCKRSQKLVAIPWLATSETFPSDQASQIFEYIPMRFLEPPPRTHLGDQYAIVTRDRYWDCKEAIPFANTAASHVTWMFIDTWVMSYSIQNYVQLTIGCSLSAISLQHYMHS